MNRLNIVLILAGGQGNRIQQSRPKQFMEIEGQPIIGKTISVFENHPDIDQIAIVCTNQWKDYVEHIIHSNGYTKFIGTFPGGESSIRSLRNGMEGLLQLEIPSESNILVHDAVRPMVSEKIISDNIKTCNTYGNAITGVQSNEAYIKSSNGIQFEGFTARHILFRAQTPQSLTLGALQNLFHKADLKGISSSQSLYTLMVEMGESNIYISKGEERNFKITVPQDIEMYRALILLEKTKKHLS